MTDETPATDERGVRDWLDARDLEWADRYGSELLKIGRGGNDDG